MSLLKLPATRRHCTCPKKAMLLQVLGDLAQGHQRSHTAGGVGAQSEALAGLAPVGTGFWLPLVSAIRLPDTCTPAGVGRRYQPLQRRADHAMGCGGVMVGIFVVAAERC